MKTIKLYIVALLVLFFASCSQKDSFDYFGGSQIYINSGDSTFFSFATKPSSQMVHVIKIPIKVSGMSVGHDREIEIEINKEKTSATYGTLEEGGHFTIDKCIISKDSVNSFIAVNLFRKVDLKDKNVDLFLYIKSNDEFQDGFGTKKLIYKIGMNDMLTIPANWNSFIKTYFGAPSLVKYQFVIDTLGISEFPSAGEGKFDKGDMYFFQDKLKTALVKYKKEHGPLIDENNNEVSFG